MSEEFDGPIFSIPMEEGLPLRAWRRQNAIRLEEKEKKEKEMLREIIAEADKYKAEFYRRRKSTVENYKTANREKEKLFKENKEKFHTEASKAYWKVISELIPKEVAVIEKTGKKDKVKQPSVFVIQGPKPGKPTDLLRMRNVLVKLKHKPPAHMNPSLPESKNDIKSSSSTAAVTSPQQASFAAA